MTKYKSIAANVTPVLLKLVRGTAVKGKQGFHNATHACIVQCLATCPSFNQRT